MDLIAGTRLKSVVCSTEVVVVRPPAGDVDLRCGGHPMVMLGGEPPGDVSLDAAFSEETLLGKRYADEASGLEVLCTKGGQGTLALGTEPLPRKDAKPLPSSD